MARSSAKFDAGFIQKLKKALDQGTSKLIQSTQGKLSQAAPVDTGRLASSFFVGKDFPDRTVLPERKERGSVTVTPYKGKITFEGDWYISNNLPYAQYVALDPTNAIYGKNGRVGAAAWYTNIVNNFPIERDRIFEKEFRKYFK